MRRKGAAGGTEGADLMAAAERARRNAYAPYSDFAVGAALLTRGGRIVTGCNVENASFGLSMCAERNALFRAVAEGERDFVAIAVTAGRGRSASPCGACRQALHEFAPRLAVLWQDGGRIARQSLQRLLAHGFDLAAGRAPRRARRKAASRSPQSRRKS